MLKQMTIFVKIRWVLVVVTAAVLCASPGQAAIEKIFYSDGVILDGEIYDRVEVYDTEPLYTIVNMTGGFIGNPGMFTYDYSTLNISGGTVEFLYTYDSSTINISGGQVSNVNVPGETTIGAHDSSTINAYQGGSLIGGSGAFFELWDSSKLNVYGGGIALFLTAHDHSVVNIYDGFLFDIVLAGDSMVNVYGGKIETFLFNDYVPNTTTVNIYGYDFQYTPEGRWMLPIGGEGEGWWISKLTGYGFNGIAITWWGLPDPDTHDNINLIPEPTTLLLLGLGSLALIRKCNMGKALCPK